MYINGVEVGDNTYLLSEENGSLTVINGNNGKKELEEYINLNNTLEEEQNYEKELNIDLAQINSLDVLAKGINKIILIVPLLIGVISILHLGGFDFRIILPLSIIIDGFMTWIKVSLCSTKKKRIEEKNEITSELAEVKNSIHKIEKQIKALKEKNEYKKLDIQEEQIIPITTLEAKKTKAKMRILKLN